MLHNSIEPIQYSKTLLSGNATYPGEAHICEEKC